MRELCACVCVCVLLLLLLWKRKKNVCVCVCVLVVIICRFIFFFFFSQIDVAIDAALVKQRMQAVVSGGEDNLFSKNYGFRAFF